MRIAVSAEEPTLDSEIGEDLGHSPYFLVVDTETMEFKAVENEAASWDMGAGMKAADIVISLGAEALITGAIGMHGYSKLSQAKIMVASEEEGKIRDLIEVFKRRHGL
ncbi:MAG TPA: NifB/NifX family molybdenum-iron cluster-binding protein [Methanomassiliicoccales archaeon]|nr:NifB/NifX family molybdenum-iron cluster-binding protein [Methanomassiliicoccales archaeon]